jgi:hypothetical protein
VQTKGGDRKSNGNNSLLIAEPRAFFAERLWLAADSLKTVGRFESLSQWQTLPRKVWRREFPTVGNFAPLGPLSPHGPLVGFGRGLR